MTTATPLPRAIDTLFLTELTDPELFSLPIPEKEEEKSP